ncbi:type VI secretion system lysozyme-related protein [Gammaproteobacteria bacterium 53_120_T64]|nr:type VI secretion system lysozyme-related protein [Gammaproteobacteria bacterium 53_120_T64]
MSAIDDDKKLLAPLLDRLSNAGNHSGQRSSHQVLKQLRESVRHDLEHLFNTRYRRLSAHPQHPHLHASLIDYGLPDISTINLSESKSRQLFCRDVETAILTFEPRIRSVKVSSEQGVNANDPTICFRIEAKLHANPATETIIFDSALNPVDHNINLTEIG